MQAYRAGDYEQCYNLGKKLLSQYDLEGYKQGIGMVLVSMYHGEVRRRWCSRQGLHVLKIMAQSNSSPLIEEWLQIVMQVNTVINDLAVNNAIGNELCTLGINEVP